MNLKKVLKSPYWVEQARMSGYQVKKTEALIRVFENKKIELQRILNYNDTIQQILI